MMNTTLVLADACKDKILPLQAWAEVRNGWLEQRLNEVLPELMKREGFDMWIVAAREYNQDPVMMTLVPEPAMSVRRRTILVFSLGNDGNLERLTLDRYGYGDLYEAAWDPDAEEQYECLARAVREREPEVIGLNISEALGETQVSRIKEATRLAVGWLERRIELEPTVQPGIVELGQAIIAEAFSSRVIQPGITTTDDVA